MHMKPTTAPTATPDQALLPTDQLGAETAALGWAPDERAPHVEHWLEFLRQLVALRTIPVEPLEGRTPTYTDTPVPAGYSVAVRANTSGIRLADPPSLSTRTREDLLREVHDRGCWGPAIGSPYPSLSSCSTSTTTATPRQVLDAISPLLGSPKPRQ